jgi:cell division protein FtsL
MATRRNQSAETRVKNVLVPVIQAIGRSGKLIYLTIIGVLLFLTYQFLRDPLKLPRLNLIPL